MNNQFGNTLRKWRKQRRYSQLQLAVDIDVSSKHISFLETGRSKPSREMILKIGNFLFLPKREINSGLLAAGFSPVYAELPNNDAELEPVTTAIQQMLENHMPYPAIVLNQNWDVVNANKSAADLMSKIGFSSSTNLIQAIIDDDPKTSKIINWRESALAILSRLRYEISFIGGSDTLESLERELSEHIAATCDELSEAQPEKLILSTQFQLTDSVLSFFSIIAQLGTVQDVTVSELKVELMFPTDDATKTYYQKC